MNKTNQVYTRKCGQFRI